MKKTTKKILSTLLAVCLLAGAVLPALPQIAYAEDITTGTLVSDNVISEYKNGVFHGLTQNADGQDLLAVPIYGSKMIVYNLDTWEVADEVYTGVSNPRGATVDSEGRVWVSGASHSLCCYDPKTRACFISSDMALGGGSAYAITQGTDGDLYFGTYSNAKIARYDIETDTFTDLGSPVEDTAYASAVVQKDNYIYATVHGKTVHKLVKLNMDGSLVTALDIAADMGTTRYLTGLNFIEGTDLLVGYGNSTAMGPLVVDATTMTKLDNLGGYTKSIKGNVTEAYDGKVYFSSYEDITVGSDTYTQVLYAYDLSTKTAAPVSNGDGGYYYGNILRGNAKNIVTDGIDYLGIEGPCIVTVQSTYIVTYDLSEGKHIVHSKDTPVDVSQGVGQSLRAATLGLPGSNEIYFGAYDTNAVVKYNTSTGAITKVTSAAGSQTDSYCWYEDTLYCGNYNVCSLTRIVDGNAASLFQLNNGTFEQARIHTITAGDSKIFAGTTPDMYYHGGTIAWYDQASGYTYVVTGPEKSDVYYAKTFDEAAYTAGSVNSGLVADPVWYNADTGAEASFSRADFTCLVEDQTINKLIYDEERNLLFGTTSVYGGTNTVPITGSNAVLFVYDVENMCLVATCDLSQKISGMTDQVKFVAGIAEDPDYAVNGKFWGVVSETLFTFTYDENTKTFSVTEELSFAKNTYWNGASRQWFPRSFVFDDYNLYVAFDKVGGLCKVNREDPSVYQQLITDADDANDVPNCYVMGEDGALYYVANGALYVINLDPTQEEYNNAAAVNSMIAALPETVTADDVQQIYEAQAAYEALTLMERALITDAVSLEDAWIDLLIARIDQLEQTLSAENLELTETLKADYDKVPLKRRSEVTNYATLAELNDILVQSHYSVVNGGLYAKLSDAVAAAPEGGHIDLLQNWAESDVILEKGVTLDLNGYTLDVTGFAGDVAPNAQGYIVDSSDGNAGLLQMESNAVFHSQNEDLPIYDSAAGGYRFFDYTLECRDETTNVGVGKEKFWFKFHFYTDDTFTQLDADAYSIVMAGGSGLSINTKVVWNDSLLRTVAFGIDESTDAFVQAWADGATENRWLYMTVGGLRQAGDGVLDITPMIRANDVTATNGTIRFVNETTPNLGDYGYGEVGPGDQ